MLFVCLRRSRRTMGLPRCTTSISPSNSPLRPMCGHGAHQRGILSFDKDYFINDEINVDIYLDAEQIMIHHHPFLYYHFIPLTFYRYFRFISERENAEWSYCGSRCRPSFNLHRYLRLKRLYYALFTSFLSIAHCSTRSWWLSLLLTPSRLRRKLWFYSALFSPAGIDTPCLEKRFISLDFLVIVIFSTKTRPFFIFWNSLSIAI